MLDLHELMEVAKKAAIQAGKAIMDIYNSKDYEVEFKDNNSPLTEADKIGHEIIVRHLSSLGLPVFSEEGKNVSFEERSSWDYYWLIDPLDGTKEFINRNGEFTVNIALIHLHGPVLGVVYAPALGSLYWGDIGNGAFKRGHDGQLTQLVINKESEVTHIVASRSHLSDETKDYIKKFPGCSTISLGSSLKFMLIAEGKAQIYPRFAPTMEWDTAAAQAIVHAAGGRVLSYPSLKTLEYNKENLVNSWFIAKV
jgi:3'(2'), 5'-bisphosphate nucleotidase